MPLHQGNWTEKYTLQTVNKNQSFVYKITSGQSNTIMCWGGRAEV